VENGEVKDVVRDPEPFTCRFIAALKRTFSSMRFICKPLNPLNPDEVHKKMQREQR
jgi:hypothetical protein